MADNIKSLWIFKSKGSESAFGGNEGYPDDPQSHYVYDTTVKNHDKVSVGDLVIIANKRYVMGVAEIEEIKTEENVPKVRFRCPVCGNQEISTRKNITPKYKCRKKHEFDHPVIQEITVDRFTAFYSSSFKIASGIETRVLKPYYINYNLYYSIQKTQLSFFQDHLPELKTLYRNSNTDQQIKKRTVTLPETPYMPDNKDQRKRKSIIQPTREGQEQFRALLSDIYGTICMLTGCTVTKAIEASHINPYRGPKDNHPANGLLLRKDLHALFDNNLLGINPHTLTIHLHPSVEDPHYQEFAGKKITFNRSDFGPSEAALVIRWEIFHRCCRDQDFR